MNATLPTPPTFDTIEHECPVCHRKIFLRCDPACPQEWRDKLKTVTACGRCADLIREKGEAFDAVRQVCITLVRGKPDEDKMRRIRANVVAQTRKLAEGLRKYYGAVFDYWQEDVVDAVLAQPKNYHAILCAWRRELVLACKREADEKKETDRLKQLERTTGNKT